MSFQWADRLPVTEWVPWWDQTIDRWHGEGLRAELTDNLDIQRHFGLDLIAQLSARRRWRAAKRDRRKGR